MTRTPEEIEKLPYRKNVGVMLVNSDDRVFVGRRIDMKGPHWQMPQGGIDPGESPKEAALRELEEETGISRDLVRIEAENEGWLAYDLPLELLDKLWDGKYRGQEQKWFRMRFLGSDAQVNIETDHLPTHLRCQAALFRALPASPRRTTPRPRAPQRRGTELPLPPHALRRLSLE